MQEDKEKEKEQRIRERAYQIWLNEGQFDDAKELHWERAKREIEEEDRKDQSRDKRACRRYTPGCLRISRCRATPRTCCAPRLRPCQVIACGQPKHQHQPEKPGD